MITQEILSELLLQLNAGNGSAAPRTKVSSRDAVLVTGTTVNVGVELVSQLRSWA
jgi:hypothetical protein